MKNSWKRGDYATGDVDTAEGAHVEGQVAGKRPMSTQNRLKVRRQSRQSPPAPAR